MTHPVTIYRLLDAALWAEAQHSGSFVGTEHDVRDGFIHFSTAAQVAETAVKHYAGRDHLVLLRVRAESLGAALRWEPSRGGALFPHLYGPLLVSHVERVEALPLGPDGLHVFPSELR